MTPIQDNKRKLEQELKQLIDRFHQENEGYMVKFVSVKTEAVTKHGKETQISIKHHL